MARSSPAIVSLPPASAPAPTPPGRRVRVARPTSTRAIVTELSRVYSLARRGLMPWDAAAKAAYILRTAGDLIAADDIDRRLSALEAERPPIEADQ